MESTASVSCLRPIVVVGCVSTRTLQLLSLLRPRPTRQEQFIDLVPRHFRRRVGVPRRHGLFLWPLERFHRPPAEECVALGQTNCATSAARPFAAKTHVTPPRSP